MRYAAVILDLDGVVYIGGDAVPFAIHALNELASGGTLLMAATNNANRPSNIVATHLQELGLQIDSTHVMTSAQAAGRHLGAILPRGSRVLAVGGEGVAQALLASGLVPVRASQDLAASSELASSVQAVLVGYGPLVAWFDLATAHWAIERGTPWFATNADPMVPLPYGKAPGNGAIVGLLRTSTGVAPSVIGKPRPELFNALISDLGTRDVLVIGDRLDTDIDGAIAAGLDSLLVLTGVHGVVDLCSRTVDRWPDWVAQDLRSLHGSVAKLWRTDGVVVTDSAHPLALALVEAANGTVPARHLDADSPAPLVDLRSL